MSQGNSNNNVRSGTKGTSNSAEITSSSIDVNTQALDVTIKGPSTLPANAATESTLSTINTKLPTGLTVVSNRLQVQLPAGGIGLTDTELRATPLITSSSNLDVLLSTRLKPTDTLTGVTTVGSITTPVVVRADTSINQVNAFIVDGSATIQPVSGTISISNFAATQAISAVSLPLPTSASTSALQTTGNTSLSSIDTKLPTGLTISATRLLTDNSGVTQPISAASLPLPSGAATASNQQTNAITDSQIRATPLPISGTVSANAVLNAETTKVIGTVNIAGTVPISGTVTANTGLTQPLTDTQIRAAALPVSGTLTVNTITGFALDSTVAKDASLATLNTSVNTLLKPSNTLAAVTTVGTITNPVTVNAGTNLNTSALALDTTLTSGNQKAITRGGARGSTAAADVTSTTIDANIQALDVSVKGAVATTLSGTPSVSVSNFPATQTITGTVSANVTLSAETTKVIGTVNVAGTIPVSGTFFQTTQPISAVSLPLSTGAATAANQQTNAITDAQIRATALPISGTVTANIGTSNLALDTTLTSGTQKSIVRSGNKGTSVATDITSTNVDANTQALDVSIKGNTTIIGTGTLATQITSLPSIPTGSNAIGSVSISNFPATQPVSLSTIAVTNIGTFPVQAAATLTAETTKVIGTVNIATNQTIAAVTTITNALPTGNNVIGTVSVNNLPTTQSISAVTLPLPTGAATSANQQTNAITDSQIRATPLPISGTITTNLGTIAGIATETTLSAINAKLPTQGQSLAANCLPVVLTELQVTALTPPLPITNYSLETTQLDINSKLPSGLTVTANRLQVQLPAGSVGLTDAQLRASPIPISGNFLASVASGPGLAASDDAITLLRRIVKLMESNATVDAANRQRIAIDAALPSGANAIGSVTLGTGVNNIGALTAGAAVIGSLNNVATIAGLDQRQYIDIARNAYGNCIRSKLVFN